MNRYPDAAVQGGKHLDESIQGEATQVCVAYSGEIGRRKAGEAGGFAHGEGALVQHCDDPGRKDGLGLFQPSRSVLASLVAASVPQSVRTAVGSALSQDQADEAHAATHRLQKGRLRISKASVVPKSSSRTTEAAETITACPVLPESFGPAEQLGETGFEP